MASSMPSRDMERALDSDPDPTTTQGPTPATANPERDRYQRWRDFDFEFGSEVLEIIPNSGKGEDKAVPRLAFVCKFCVGRTLITPKRKPAWRQAESHYNSREHKENRVLQNQIPLEELKVILPDERIFVEPVCNKVFPVGKSGQVGLEALRKQLKDMSKKFEKMETGFLKQLDETKMGVCVANDKVEQLKNENDLLRDCYQRRFTQQEDKIMNLIKEQDEIKKFLLESNEESVTFPNIRDHAMSTFGERSGIDENAIKLKMGIFCPVANSTLRETYQVLDRDVSSGGYEQHFPSLEVGATESSSKLDGTEEGEESDKTGVGREDSPEISQDKSGKAASVNWVNTWVRGNVNGNDEDDSCVTNSTSL